MNKPLRLFQKGFAGVDGVKVNNRRNAMPTKIAMRETLFAAMAERGPVHVFDAYAGTGELYKEVWHKADSYTGCDIAYEPLPKRDDRLMFAADNVRVLRAIDLSPFNVFDLDSYGSPWEPALIIAMRRKLEAGEHIGIVATDGSGRTLKANQTPKGIRTLAGLAASFSGLGRWHEEVITRCLNGMATRMGGRLIRRWEAKGRTGIAVRYVSVVFQQEGPLPGVKENQ